MTEEWTPYGLEAIRGRVLWRRRIAAVVLSVLAVVGLFVVLALLSTPTVTDTQISLAGGGNSGSIEIEKPGDMLSKPLTIGLKPGGVTHVGGPEPQGAPDRLSRASTDYPFIRDARPFNWASLVFPWGLLAGLAYAFWAAGRGATTPSAEVNFGIYKGAMPLEMITASYAHLVRTQRLANGSLFGKERADHVPPPRVAASFQPVRRR